MTYSKYAKKNHLEVNSRANVAGNWQGFREQWTGIEALSKPLGILKSDLTKQAFKGLFCKVRFEEE
jgi:hypothetical protein